MKKHTKKCLFATSALGISLYAGFVGKEFGEGIEIGSVQHLEALQKEEVALQSDIGAAGDRIIELVTATGTDCFDALRPFLPGQPWQSSDPAFMAHVTEADCNEYPDRPDQLISASSDLRKSAKRQGDISVEIDHAVSEVEANKHLSTSTGLVALIGASLLSGAYLRRRFRSLD